MEVLLPCVTSPKIITPTQPPPAAVATTAAAAAVGSLMAIPTVDHTITRGGGKSNKKDGVKKGMSSSTGGTKLREKYTKHKQDKKHGATIGTAMTHGDNNNGGIKSSASIPFAPVESGSMGHQGKLYVYDMPPPRTQTSPLQSHDGFDGDGVGQGLGVGLGVGVGLGKKLSGQPLLSRLSLSPSKESRFFGLPTATADDIRLLETKGVSIASPTTAPGMTTSSGRPLYRPQSAPTGKPSANIKLTSESLKKLEVSLLSSSSPHHNYHPQMVQDPHSRRHASLDLTDEMESNPQLLQHQTYSETVVVPKVSVSVSKRNGQSQPMFDEEFVVEDVDDDDDDDSGEVAPPDYSWLRGAANKLNGVANDRGVAEYGTVDEDDAVVTSNDTKRVIAAQPTLSVRQHEFAWTNGATTTTTTSQLPRNKGPMKGRPSSANSATNIRPNTANKKAFLNLDVPDKLPDMTALDGFGLAGLAYRPKVLNENNNEGAVTKEISEKKPQPQDRDKDMGSGGATNNNQNKKLKSKSTKKDSDEPADEPSSSMFVGGGPSGSGGGAGGGGGGGSGKHSSSSPPDRNVRLSTRIAPLVQPKPLNGVHMRDTATNELVRDNHREAGRPLEAVGSRPQSASTLGQLL